MWPPLWLHDSLHEPLPQLAVEPVKARLPPLSVLGAAVVRDPELRQLCPPLWLCQLDGVELPHRPLRLLQLLLRLRAPLSGMRLPWPCSDRLSLLRFRRQPRLRLRPWSPCQALRLLEKARETRRRNTRRNTSPVWHRRWMMMLRSWKRDSGSAPLRHSLLGTAEALGRWTCKSSGTVSWLGLRPWASFFAGLQPWSDR